MHGEPRQGEGPAPLSALHEPAGAEWGCSLLQRAAPLHGEGVLSRGPSGGLGVQQQGGSTPQRPGQGGGVGHHGAVPATTRGQGSSQRLVARGISRAWSPSGRKWQRRWLPLSPASRLSRAGTVVRVARGAVGTEEAFLTTGILQPGQQEVGVGREQGVGSAVGARDFPPSCRRRPPRE